MVDGNNYVYVRKQAAANQIRFIYQAGGVVEQYVHNISTTDWFRVSITWSKAGDVVWYYVDGAQITSDTVLGNWAGALANTNTVVGAASTAPVEVWDGYLAHCAVWNRPLPDAAIYALYRTGVS